MNARALVIRPGDTEFSVVTLTNDDQIREIIGNWMTSCFTVGDPYGAHITGYCDDEGLLEHSPNFGKPSVAIGNTLRSDAPYPIMGPVVIVGVNGRGNTRGLTDAEVGQFLLFPAVAVVHAQSTHRVPLLQWQRSR